MYNNIDHTIDKHDLINMISLIDNNLSLEGAMRVILVPISLSWDVLFT